jgi:NADH-quinone oxidoreductase subunit J
MTLAAAFFYLFAVLTVAAGFLVITAKNPVHAVLWLIFAFFNAAGLFLLLGAEFLAMILVVVYVGAVAVLFLFVVMMLDVDFAALRAGFIKHAPLGLLLGLVVLTEIVMLIAARLTTGGSITASVLAKAASPVVAGVANTEAIGRILYTKHIHLFQMAGLVLLVAMIGAIVLTLRHKSGVRRQDISVQNARSKKTAMEVIKVPAGGSVIPDKAAAKGNG